MAPLFHITHDTVGVSPGTKLVKAADYAAFVEAEKLLDRAKAEAERIMADALAVYEAQKARGYVDGKEESRLEHAQKIMETAVASIDYLSAMEKSVAGLVLKALEKIIGEMDDRELIFRVVKTGLSVARNEQKVQVKVCPDDLKAVRTRLDDLLATYAGIGFLDVAADARLKKGDCLIESELGIVDAGIDTQLKAVKKAILKRI